MTAPALTWPPALFDGAILGRLDGAARAQLADGARLVDLAPGAVIFREGDDSDAFFLVAAGAVALQAVRRGDQAASVLRVARAGDSFGEEALLGGLRRRVTACAVEAARVVEIPIAVFRRVTARGDSPALEREARYLERAAARDLVAASALGRDLGADDAELLVDGMRLERFERGAHLFEPGDRADRGYVLVDGLIQIQTEDGDRISVVAYLGRGDLFGDEEALAGRPRRAAAVAAGESWCAVVPVDLLRTLADRNPGLMARLRRLSDAQREAQGELVGAASARSTQHVFRDLYRMQMARSLLVIDQDRCVRCGHCAWSCAEAHGVSRLVRRGDKVVTGLVAEAAAASLLLPSTCQHCRHAACMIDCPTGAIGRDPEGEVFVREELCTGCGNCAKSCPWDNIQMAPRTAGGPGLSVDVAVKCDLCRGYQAPVCVESCPTDALVRLDPTRDLAEVASMLGGSPIAGWPFTGRPAAFAPPAGIGALPADRSRRSASVGVPGIAPGLPPLSIPSREPAAVGIPGAGATPGAKLVAHRSMVLAGAGAAAVLLAALGWVQQQRGAWVPGHGPGLAAGVMAALILAGLAAYAAPKRLIRRSMRRRERGPGGIELPIDRRPPPRSRTRPHLLAHLALGLVCPAAAIAHAGARLPASPGGALAVALILATLLGAAGALAYRGLPARLTRLERRGALPEDLAGEREALLTRLYREATGQNELIKAIAGRLLLPYARASLGWIALVLSGRSLAGEEDRLRERIGAALAGRGEGRLDGVDALIRTAVELRALPARRALTAGLRAWLPLHMIAAAMVLALLVVHVVGAVIR
ncbi:MAG TPA: cyclic nucleotide-binding domain-containing protein [Kofleriaceae bacterium]|nr:cyclic nucleotide-binding domain-containing protein [Kofleriaceae bacterium]